MDFDKKRINFTFNLFLRNIDSRMEFYQSRKYFRITKFYLHKSNHTKSSEKSPSMNKGENEKRWRKVMAKKLKLAENAI